MRSRASCTLLGSPRNIIPDVLLSVEDAADRRHDLEVAGEAHASAPARSTTDAAGSMAQSSSGTTFGATMSRIAMYRFAGSLFQTIQLPTAVSFT
jgi:hypothetical protein